jgi:uncharacterized phiE125 gp8 family phage protein
MAHSITLTQTGIEPIVLEDALNFLRVDAIQGGADNDLVTALIQSSRSVAEKYINRLIVQYTVTINMDEFPAGGFKLPYGPVQSFTSIQVTDNQGNQTVWNASNYIVDLTGGRVVYALNATFPLTYAEINAIEVTYVAGYGLATDNSEVPAGIVQACRHMVAESYENRETATELSPLVCMLLNPFRKLVIG